MTASVAEPLVAATQAEQRIAAARELTELLERNPSFSFIRLGDGEIYWLRHIQQGKDPPKYRYFENAPSTIEATQSTSGLEARHYRRFMDALEHSSYLDYCESNPNVRDTLHFVEFQRDPTLHRNSSPDTSNILFEWTHFEMREYVRRHRCLIAGAESALLRELWKDPAYRRLAERFLPEDAQLVFHQVRDNGRNYSENLDLIEQDLADIARSEGVDTILVSLATGAKIVCYELARDENLRAIDFGSFSRALAYAGSPGYQTHRNLHNPFMFRVPLATYMDALERAHPELTPAMIISKAHAQLALELQDLQPLRFNSADTVTGIISMPRQRIDAFKDEARTYRRRYRETIRSDAEARRLDSAFERWRRKRGIGLDGQIFVRLVALKAECRRAGRALGILRRPATPEFAVLRATPIPGLYGELLPRFVRDAVRLALRPSYRRSLLNRWRRNRISVLRGEGEPRLYELSGGFILSGPFKGLKYTSQAAGSAWAPKLLGTYECELIPIIEDIVSGGYDSVIDIGAAEGYYAVGLAKRMPGAEIVCFEKEEAARRLLGQFATENDVASRLEVHGVATADRLESVLKGMDRTVVICDVEGAEADLIDPSAVPGLKTADILVELHDFVNPEIASILRARFHPTHRILEIPARDRRLEDWTVDSHLGRRHKLALLDELRPAGMRWFWMVQRNL
jgi:hypothetical protein